MFFKDGGNKCAGYRLVKRKEIPVENFSVYFLLEKKKKKKRKRASLQKSATVIFEMVLL